MSDIILLRMNIHRFHFDLLFQNKFLIYQTNCLGIGVISVADPDPNSDPTDPLFLGLQDLDPLVRGMDPDPALESDPDLSIIMQK
jgi:hypothetical protein